MIAFLIPVLEGALVGTVHIKVLSIQDLEFTSSVIGQQISPAVLASISNLSVMDNIISTTINGKLTGKQPYLWFTGQSDMNVNSLAQASLILRLLTSCQRSFLLLLFQLALMRESSAISHCDSMYLLIVQVWYSLISRPRALVPIH